jgi:glycine/D-amino acid oxidase-like deaminating enzyme
MGALELGIVGNAGAMIFGAKTYREFSQHWLHMPRTVGQPIRADLRRKDQPTLVRRACEVLGRLEPEDSLSSGELLRKQMLDVLQQLADVEIDYCWGGLVDCTQDRYPRAGTADGLIYGMGYSGHGAQLSTLIGSVLADLAMGRTDTNPIDGMHWNAAPLHTGKPWFLPMVGTYYRLKDMLP